MLKTIIRKQEIIWFIIKYILSQAITANPYVPNYPYLRTLLLHQSLRQALWSLYFRPLFMTPSDKPGLWKRKHCFHRAAFSIHVYIHRFFSKLCGKREQCFLQMLICDQNSRLWSVAAQSPRRQIRSWSFCPSINRVFSDGVTFYDITRAADTMYREQR